MPPSRDPNPNPAPDRAAPSAPADARLAAWRRLADPASAALVAAADEVAAVGTTPAGIAGLRRRFPDAPVAEALDLAAARHRAASKFPNADRLLLDRPGVEQATSAVVAAWKASRFGDRPVLDLCCGIGGDAMALAARGPCVGVDLDPVRAFMAAHNAGIDTRVDSVESTPLDAPYVHLDPARRDEASGRRSWRLDELVPGLDVIARVVGEVDGAAVKLGPGVPWPLPRWHDRQSLSIVAEDRRLVQAIVWTGDLARTASCEAVDLPSGDTIEGEPVDWPTDRSIGGDSTGDLFGGPFGEVLVEFHPAVERIRLGPTACRAAFGEAADAFREPAAGLGLVTGPATPVESAIARGDDRWFRAVRIDAVLPARLDLVADAVRGLADRVEASRVIVRTRAGAIDADAWTKRLGAIVPDRAGGGAIIEVGGWRIGRRTLATVGLALSS